MLEAQQVGVAKATGLGKKAVEKLRKVFRETAAKA
jgi:hypothetical protein